MNYMSHSDLLPTDSSHANHGIKRFGFRHNPYRRESRTSSVCSSAAGSYPKQLDPVKMERTSSLSSWDDSANRSHAPSPTLCETPNASSFARSLVQARRSRANAQPEDERKTKKAATERVARGVQGDYIKMMELILIEYGITDMTLLNENNAKNSNLKYKKTEIMQNIVELVARLEREGAERDEVMIVLRDQLDSVRDEADRLDEQSSSLKEENEKLKRMLAEKEAVIRNLKGSPKESLPFRCNL